MYFYFQSIFLSNIWMNFSSKSTTLCISWKFSLTRNVLEKLILLFQLIMQLDLRESEIYLSTFQMHFLRLFLLCSNGSWKLFEGRLVHVQDKVSTSWSIVEMRRQESFCLGKRFGLGRFIVPSFTRRKKLLSIKTALSLTLQFLPISTYKNRYVASTRARRTMLSLQL